MSDQRRPPIAQCVEYSSHCSNELDASHTLDRRFRDSLFRRRRIENLDGAVEAIVRIGIVVKM